MDNILQSFTVRPSLYSDIWENPSSDNFKEIKLKKEIREHLIAIAKENCTDGYIIRAGDAVNFSIGQGDTVITPLKQAQIYSAIANGGTLWQPLVAKAIVKTDGTVVKTFTPKVMGKVDVDKSTFAWLRDALHQVTINGTAAGDFAGFPIPVAGKTGTGEVFGLNKDGTKKNSTSWFASFAPVDKPQYAVVVMVSQGGTGAAAAGVGAREIYNTIFGVSGSKQIPEKVIKIATTLPKISAATKVVEASPSPSSSPIPSASAKAKAKK